MSSGWAYANNYGLQLERLSVDEGLSDSTGVASLQDDLGFIWIATTHGLNRYDGYTNTFFDGGYELDKSNILLLKKTKHGNIFVSTRFIGAYLINPTTLEVEKIYSGKLAAEDAYFSPIFAFVDKKDGFYFSINEKVYWYQTDKKKRTLLFSLPDPNHIITSLATYKNTLYLGSNNRVYTYNPATTKVTPIFTANNAKTPVNNLINFITLDKKQGLLISTTEGLYLLPFENEKVVTQQPKQLISSLAVYDYIASSFGNFIATNKGLYTYDFAKGTANFLLRFDQGKYSTHNNLIHNIMIDKSGLMWLTSHNQGVLKWSVNTNLFSHLIPSKPSSEKVWSIQQDLHQDKIIWLGTENGLVKYNQHTQQKKVFLATTARNAHPRSIYAIFPAALQTGSSYLWLMSQTGLLLFNTQTEQLTPLPQASNTQKQIGEVPTYGYYLMANNTFAFFTEQNYYTYNGDTGETHVIKGLKEKIGDKIPHSFLAPLPQFPDEFVLSLPSALYRYNEKTQTLTLIYKAQPHSPQAYITIDDWLIDNSNNTLWLASSGEGLIGLNASNYEIKHLLNHTTNSNLREVYSLQTDADGFLWAATANGLYQLNLNTLALRHFTTKDGILTNKFNPYSYTKFKNGNLAFGSDRGAIIFSPSDFITPPEQVFSTDITNISLLSKKLSYHPLKYNNQPLLLAADDIGLEVSFSNFDHHHTDKTQYNVSLTGPTSFNYERLKSNKVFFATLPPGEYRLSVAAYNLGNKILSTPRTLNFKVAYAPWQSPLAISLYVLIVLSILLFMFWQYYARQRLIKQAHAKVIASQQQTKLALESSQSGIWELNLAKNEIKQNRIINELGYSQVIEQGSVEQHFRLIHPEDRRLLEAKWKAFKEQTYPAQWNEAYRLKHADGHWLWYQDLGKVTRFNEHGKPLVISGIYTNVTNQHAMAQRASILDDAFSQLDDWLLILDEQLQPLSANNSFINAFCAQLNDAELELKHFINAFNDKSYQQYLRQLKSLKAKENWQTEAYITPPNNDPHPIHISVTAISKDEQSINYYVIVITDISRQKRAENELRFLANYDPLTHLPNRTLMHNTIEQAIKQAEKDASLCALLFIDLDKFKPVNDSFGHAVGDKLLCDISQRISRTLTTSATLGRQSSDEFLLLIRDLSSPQELEKQVQNLIKELAKKVTIDDISLTISASIGVALYPLDAHNAEALIRNADIAMIHAKQAGRNSFKFFTAQMNNAVTQKLLLENALKDAYKENSLFNNYQPIIDNQSKKINGVELLLRWKHKNKLISPNEFIPIAEEIGLIDRLTEQALHRALNELQPLLQKNSDFYLSLNLSPVHILKINLTERLLLILSDYQIPPSQLRLEITESSLLEDKQKAREQLSQLKAAGFNLFLDDFGTGYSSLTYLSQFPIDVIKIDQSFVRKIGKSESDESIIRTIHTLATSLNLYCVAEGVETPEQVAFLQRIGCHHLQGYYFSKPVTYKVLQSDAHQTMIQQKLL